MTLMTLLDPAIRPGPSALRVPSPRRPAPMARPRRTSITTPQGQTIDFLDPSGIAELRAGDAVAVWRELGLGVEAGATEEEVTARAGEGELEVLTERLRAAAQLTAVEAAATKDANERCGQLALSLAFHDGVGSLHRVLGIASATWAQRRLRALQLEPNSVWLETATAEQLSERALAVGIERRTDAVEELPRAVQELLHSRARGDAARLVRNALIRELYLKHLNQGDLERITGMTQAGLWQVLNPGHRSR